MTKRLFRTNRQWGRPVLSMAFALALLVAIVVVSLSGLGTGAAQRGRGDGSLTVNTAPTDTAAWALARYAVDLKYENVPPDVIATAKRHILDSLGVAYGGYPSQSITILRNVIMSEGGIPESTIIGSGQKTSASDATMVNGAMIRYLDFSDTYRSPKGFMHPSNSIAEALAVAERQHASGKDFILATVLAYEIQARLADTFTWPGFEQHSAGGIVAPIIAGKLMGLTAEQIANAIGIGGSHNFALAGDYGIGYTSNMKALGYAAGSASGVTAALLAQKGFTGPVTILESYQRNFEKTATLATLSAPRTDFAITKVWMKSFESFHDAHSAIAAAIQIVKEHNIKPDQIQKVFVRGMPNRQTSPEPTHNTSIPRTKEDADHNPSFVLAMGIIDGEVGTDQYAEEQWNNPKVQELMGKMEFQGDAELTKTFPAKWTSVVEITTNDKQVYTQQVDFPKGAVENPFTDQELEGKFNKMATKLMPKAQADQIIKTVYDLDKLSDISEFTKLLKVPKP